VKARNLIIVFLAVGFLSCQLAIPTTEAAPTFTVQAYNVVGGGGSNDNDLNSTLESLGIWDAIDGGAVTGPVTIGSTTYNIQNIHNDTDSVISYNNGTFSPNNAWSTIGSGAGLGGDDFAVRALATVTFQPGTYSVATGSDDGRYLRLAGITFDSFGGQGGTVQSAADTVMFNGTTGHNYSVGTFTVAAPTTATLDTHFFERGGGDSFNLAIKSGADTSMGGPGDGWELLQHNALGGSVSVDNAYTLPSRLKTVARLSALRDAVVGAAYVDNNGTAQAPASWTLEERGTPTVGPGLLGEYYTRSGDNPGTFMGSRIDLVPGSPAPTEFYFPNDPGGANTSFADGPWGRLEDNFFVRWTGSLDVPQDGTYNFRMNTDDRSRIFIDVDGDGTLEAAPGQPAWTVNWSGVTLTAGLHDVEFNAIEYGGGDWTRVEWELPGTFGWQTIPASYFSTFQTPWTTLASGTNAVGDTVSDGLFGVTMPLGDHYLRLTVDDGYGNIAVAEGNLAFIPEPSTFLLAALGLLGLGWFVRRRKS
jgi:hypothetical protein